MAGYSGTPLGRKLGIKPGHHVVLDGAPDGFEKLLDPLPEEVRVVRGFRGRGPADVIVCFADRRATLARRLPLARKRLDRAGGLWIAWPKKASGVATDLGDAVVRSSGLAAGLVDNKVCAIDETWSGLRFVVRLADR